MASIKPSEGWKAIERFYSRAATIPAKPEETSIAIKISSQAEADIATIAKLWREKAHES